MQQQQPSPQQQQQTSQQQQQQQQLSKPGQKRRFTEEREEAQEGFQVRGHAMCNSSVTALSCVLQGANTVVQVSVLPAAWTFADLFHAPACQLI
jgi:hypothetical protein